jgi:hypothetical protein
VNQIAVVATLKPGAEEEARRLLAEGPPFDPEGQGFRRHAAFLSANEIVFVFEAPEVEWRLDDLVDEQWTPLVQRAFDAWRPLLDGYPRLARVAYAWPDDAGDRAASTSRAESGGA